MTGNRYILREDIKSVFHGRQGAKVYGKKGEVVKEISICEAVAIVEDSKGERFPASINKLKKL